MSSRFFTCLHVFVSSRVFVSSCKSHNPLLPTQCDIFCVVKWVQGPTPPTTSNGNRFGHSSTTAAHFAKYRVPSGRERRCRASASRMLSVESLSASFFALKNASRVGSVEELHGARHAIASNGMYNQAAWATYIQLHFNPVLGPISICPMQRNTRGPNPLGNLEPITIVNLARPHTATFSNKPNSCPPFFWRAALLVSQTVQMDISMLHDQIAINIDQINLSLANHQRLSGISRQSQDHWSIHEISLSPPPSTTAERARNHTCKSCASANARRSSPEFTIHPEYQGVGEPPSSALMDRSKTGVLKCF